MGTKGKKTKKPKVWSPTVKQQKFVDCYEGNATKAAKDAGYKGTESYLRQIGHKLVTNGNILALIEKRQKAEKGALIADRAEREEILSSILRNNKAYEVSSPVGAEIGETEDGKFKFVKVAVSDKNKIKAIDVLNKMDAIYVQKHQVAGKDGEKLDLNVVVYLPDNKRDK